MSERKNLKILEVKPAQNVGQKQIPKLSFKASDDGAEYMYFTFKRNVFDLIKEGEVIEADVETSSHWYDGQEYWDRKVTQVYKDGQPVNVKQGYRSKSPEEIQSIKAQVAAKAITEMFVADKLDLFIDSQNYLAIGLREWLKTALVQDNPLAEVKPIPAQTMHTLPAKQTGGEDETDLKSLKFKTQREFKEACQKYLGLSEAQLAKEIPEYDLSKTAQVHKAWQYLVAIYGPRAELQGGVNEEAH